jgi:hypothetical protein
MKSFLRHKGTAAIVSLLFAVTLGATTRSEVKLLEASEEIRFISQQIVKDYFYLAKFPRKREAARSLERGLADLDEKVRLIASVTKSEDTRDILTFLAYSRDQILETVAEPYSRENASLMLDYSETLLEGAESIANEHAYAFSQEEEMLINVKKMAFLVERITKYYMTFQLGISDTNSIQQLKESVAAFDTALRKLERYGYRGESARSLAALEHFWFVVRGFCLGFDKDELPNIMYISADHLEKTIGKLELYHTQNL